MDERHWQDTLTNFKNKARRILVNYIRNEWLREFADSELESWFPSATTQSCVEEREELHDFMSRHETPIFIKLFRFETCEPFQVHHNLSDWTINHEILLRFVLKVLVSWKHSEIDVSLFHLIYNSTDNSIGDSRSLRLMQNRRFSSTFLLLFQREMIWDYMRKRSNDLMDWEMMIDVCWIYGKWFDKKLVDIRSRSRENYRFSYRRWIGGTLNWRKIIGISVC